MFSFSRTHARLLLGVGLAFAALVALRLHGFSLPVWHDVVDGSPAPEVWLGEARAVRVDDWMTQLPLILGQSAHDPPFPVVNDEIGLGQNMLLPLPVPVAHPLAVFRPTLWGFFLGDDVGLAWMWGSRLLGLFAVWTLVFVGVTGARLPLAAAGGALLVVSPFFQFWSLNAAPVVGYAGLCVLGAGGLLAARTRRGIFGCALLLGWAGGCFLLTVYPAYQVPLAWLVVLLTGAWTWQERARLPWRVHVGARAAGAALAVAVVAAAGLGLYAAAHDAITVMLHTAYPGARISTGGDKPFWELLTGNFAAGLQVDDWDGLLNVCEAASFWLFFPALGAAELWRWRQRRALDPVAAAMLALATALTLYAWLGVPDALARATGLSFVPGRRAVIAIGLADAVLLLRVLARPDPPLGRRAAAVLAAGWAALLLAAGLRLRVALPELAPAALVALAALGGAAAWAVLARPLRPAAIAAALVVLLGASTLWFNPLVHGGAGALRAMPLSRAILAIDRAEGGESTWLVFGSRGLANLFHALGVHVLNGTHTVPHLALWQRLDPRGAQQRIYNRYADAILLAAPGPPRFRLKSATSFFLSLDPGSPAVRALGADHVLLAAQDPRAFEQLSGWRRTASYGAFHLYAVPGAAAPPAAGDAAAPAP